MFGQSTAEKDTPLGVTPAVRPRMPWRVQQVKALQEFCLQVGFNDGTEGIVHMNNLIHSDKAGVFATLSDPARFAAVYVEHGAVTWPGEIDLAPDAMYRAIKEKGEWVL